MTVIIADIGSNFTTLQEAYISIAEASKAGADMAKFQLYSEHDLYGEGSTERNIESMIPLLAECCKEHKVAFGCTAFSVEGLRIIDPYVKAHKIASSCVTHIPLLEAVAATKKPVLLSVGACSDDEIATAINILGREWLTLLYCQASYPSRMYNPFAIENLRNKFGIDVGYSDHTIDIFGAPLHAATHCASVIEKHFTAFPRLMSPDRPHSLTADEFLLMVQAIKYNGVPPSLNTEEEEFHRLHKVRKLPHGYYRVRA